MGNDDLNSIKNEVEPANSVADDYETVMAKIKEERTNKANMCRDYFVDIFNLRKEAATDEDKAREAKIRTDYVKDFISKENLYSEFNGAELAFIGWQVKVAKIEVDANMDLQAANQAILAIYKKAYEECKMNTSLKTQTRKQIGMLANAMVAVVKGNDDVQVKCAKVNGIVDKINEIRLKDFNPNQINNAQVGPTNHAPVTFDADKYELVIPTNEMYEDMIASGKTLYHPAYGDVTFAGWSNTNTKNIYVKTADGTVVETDLTALKAKIEKEQNTVGSIVM